LFTTLLRPSDGAAANVWSDHFEENVRAVLDGSAWRPPDHLRSLIGRRVYRRDRNQLTNLDAVAYLDGRLLFVSCKSIAFPVSALRGEFAITRNIVEKVHKAASEWSDVIQTLRKDPDLLGVNLSDGTVIDGIVVFPAVPFSDTATGLVAPTSVQIGR
jgi:hypothetical protein